jgi:hypothetical protein
VLQESTGKVILPVASGARVLPALARRLAEADVAIADLTVRRPTLDDVFLSLTGRPTADAADVRDPVGHPSPTAGTDGRAKTRRKGSVS